MLGMDRVQVVFCVDCAQAVLVVNGAQAMLGIKHICGEIAV